MDNIRVSPRDLGKMLLKKFCPRCYWILIGLGFRVPFDMPMAGLMYNMDRFEKALVECHFEDKGLSPKWLASMNCVEVAEFPEKMTMEFPKYGLTMVGKPDAVLRKKDGSLFLIDYKTAKDKGSDDPFMPAYETQLLGYVHLLEANGVGKVSEVALVYFDNDLVDYYDEPLELLTRSGLTVPFTAKIHPIEFSRQALDPLLKAFRGYADMLAPPKGRDHCKDCERLERLENLQTIARTAAKTDQSHMLNRDCILDSMARNRAEALITESCLRQDEIGEEYLAILDSAPGPMDL
jgi:hypothetical protein